jgi:hypothetical protein
MNSISRSLSDVSSAHRVSAVRRRPAPALRDDPSNFDELESRLGGQHRRQAAAGYARKSSIRRPRWRLEHHRSRRSIDRNVGKPGWRVPKKSPDRAGEIALGVSKSIVIHVSPQPLARLSETAPEGERERLMLVAATRPRSGGCEGRTARRSRRASRSRVRHVDADLDHGGRDEHLILTRRERLHHRSWRRPSSGRAGARRYCGTRPAR